MVMFDDDETNALWGNILMHYDKIAGKPVPQAWLLKRIFQNEIDAWGE